MGRGVRLIAQGLPTATPVPITIFSSSSLRTLPQPKRRDNGSVSTRSQHQRAVHLSEPPLGPVDPSLSNDNRQFGFTLGVCAVDEIAQVVPGGDIRDSVSWRQIHLDRFPLHHPGR